MAPGHDSSSPWRGPRTEPKVGVPAGTATVRSCWGLSLVVGLVAVGWHRTFWEMWLRWFPAWHTTGLSWPDRLTQGNSYYTHGPLVALASGLMAWHIHRRVGWSRARSTSATWWGGGLLAVSITLHLLSVSPSARVMFVSGFALIGVLVGLVLVWGGWPMARAYGLPIVFLVFMVPMPEVAIVDLNFRLKLFAGRAALWLTHHVFGVPAWLDGSYIHLPPDADGRAKSLVIENVCSGLRSLIALVWFASLFAVVCRVSGRWRILMLAAAVPVAVGCNVVRITSLNLAAHYGSVQIAGPGGWFHDFSGLLVFAMALACLLGLERAVMGFGRWRGRCWVDWRLLGFLETVSIADAGEPAKPRRLPLAVLAVTAVVSACWSVSVWGAEKSVLDVGGVPETIVIDGRRFLGRDRGLDQRTLMVLEYPDYLYRVYTDPNTDESVDLLIVFSANNRKGTHPPEVCIEGGGHIVIDKQLWPVRVAGAGDLALRHLLTQRFNAVTCFLYTYKCGKRYTPSFFAQQFWVFFNGLTAWDTAGAMIRLSVAGGPQDVDRSKNLTMAAAKRLLPLIDKALK